MRREMDTYTPEEIAKVLRAADKDRNGHLWYLALSGLRRGEVAGLKMVGHRPRRVGTLTIAHNRVQVGAATVAENEPKTHRHGAHCLWIPVWSRCSSVHRRDKTGASWHSVPAMPTAAMSP